MGRYQVLLRCTASGLPTYMVYIYIIAQLDLYNIRQKIFNQKYYNVGMTQQQSLAKKDKKSDVGMVTG